MEELLQQLAEARGLPTSLVERSAQARAQATGQSTEDVLNEWAAEEGIAEASVESPAADAPDEPAPEAEPASSGPEPPVAPQAPEPVAAEPAPPLGEGGLSGDELLEAVAGARGMPAPLVERSAEARARKEGITTDAVLREWAVEAGIDVGVEPAEAPAETPASAEPEPAPVAPEAAAAVVGGLSGAALLDAVAEARGMPSSLVERSAGARAKKEGITTDAVLQEWAVEAGIDIGGASPAEAAPATAPPVEVAPEVEPPPEEPATAVAVEETGAATAAASIEVIEPTETVPTPNGAQGEDAIETPRRYPVWLAAAFVVIPLAAVLYLMVVPNGPQCGSAGQLAVDPETGQAVGCDGAAYGVGEMNAFAAGETIYQASCAVCHGADGNGGAGPAMTGGAVLVAFPEASCLDHIKWVDLGSTGWPESTYGATAKPVAGGMPGFETSLLEEEIAQVVLYERVAFGGEDLAAAEGECGLGEEAEVAAASG